MCARPNAGARPMLLTHGWPGSVIEFLKVIDPLTRPTEHGGSASDAFHLVIPSLPGYGFSDAPTEGGWNTARIARAWAVLMARLGYRGYIAQGGDWGAGISLHMGEQGADGLAAIHLNLPLGFPTEQDRADMTPAEKAAMEAMAHHQQYGRGYSEIQRTRPQTLGFGLADSPVGQAAWIYDKFRFWTDCDGDPLNALSMDEMLDNIMLYWLTNSGASSARLYYESYTDFAARRPPHPVGISAFPREIFGSSRRWTERLYNLVYWNETAKGGHFAAFEQPALFTEELRAFARAL